MGVLLFILGLAASGFAGYVLIQIWLMQNWETVKAEVLVCEVATKTRRDIWGVATYYYPKVSYRYQLQGRYYTGSRYQFLPLAVSEEEALEDLTGYRNLSHVEAYYNPSNKQQAVMKRDLDRLMTIYLGVLGGVGVLLMILAFV